MRHKFLLLLDFKGVNLFSTIQDTEGKNIRRMGKEQETREKECGNLLDKERKQGSRARIFIQNLPLLTLETT